MSDCDSERNPLDELAEEFIERFRRGERPALSEYTGKYPELAGEIRDLFPALVMLEDVRPVPGPRPAESDTGGPALERLGDYRILREVGRGGMGIVYEAEQESLGRHVALKVLPRHALLDPSQLQRFQREARAAARLHHTNIVPVFGVGEQDGLHYYVMQFIHGQGLDQVLAVLKHLRGTGPDVPTRPPDDPEPARLAPAARPAGLSRVADLASVVAVANSLLSGVFAAPAADAAAEPVLPRAALRATGAPAGDGLSFLLDPSAVPLRPAADSPGPGSAPGSGSASSSQVALPGSSGQVALSDSGRPYWQSVARIGIQVAEALDYAHGQGVLHRDVKPANLLLDTQGVVWVTDFGLAKSTDSEDLTHTGDVVGTLRYMAPERFQGRADVRSDVYALGLTLYELLTLRPAFDESDRQNLMHRVLCAQPPRPRKLNPAVPRDLETVVLKAMAPNPAHRYASAAEMAADLRRFTDDKPIHARPASEVEKLWRWCRRNPSLAILAGLLLVTLVLGIVGVTWKWREAEQRRAEAEDEKDRAGRAEHQTVVERDRAVEARKDAQRVSAGALLDKGTALAEQGEVGRGLWWMLEALRAAPEEPPELRQVIRTNLAAWLPQAHTLRLVIEQPRPVGGCAFHPDGRRFLTLAGKGGVDWWETETGQPIGPAFGEGSPCTFALSPDGQRALVLFAPKPGQARQAQLHDAATGRPLGPALPHPGEVFAAAFTPDGKQLVTGCADGVVRVWDAAAGQLQREGFRDSREPIKVLAISPDGKTLAIATAAPHNDSLPSTISLWDLDSGKRLGPPVRHTVGITSIAFSPDGKWLVSGGMDQAASILDVATGQPAGPPLAHTTPVRVVRFTPDGQMLLTGGEFGVLLWGKLPRPPFLGRLPIHGANANDLAVSPDGQTLVMAGETRLTRGVIEIFQLARGLSRPVVAGRGAVPGQAIMIPDTWPWYWRHLAGYSPDATRLVAGGSDGCARLFDTATGQPAPTGAGPLRHLWKAVGVTAFSPGGRFVATASRHTEAIGDVRIWDAATGRPSGQELPLMNHVAALAFSPDEKILATGGYDGTVRFWDPATGKPLGPPLSQGRIVVALAFSPDGKTLAAGHPRGYAGDAGVVLWDVAGRQRIGQLLPGVSALFRFSPDGRHLLTGEGSTLGVWDAATGLPVGPPSFESAALTGLAFRPDGRMVLTAGRDGTVRLREFPSLKTIGAPLAHPHKVTVAVFSPDPEGRLVLTGCADGSARLWDRATQMPLGPPALQSRPLVTATFTPDGRAFLTAAEDGRTQRWPVPGPLEGGLDELALRLQVATGREMRDGQVDVPLDFGEWERRRQKAARDGLADGPPACAPDARDFHDARARDAEQLGDSFAARWHLDRLIAAQEADKGPPSSTDWLAYARRGALHTAAGRFDLAKGDYARARKVGSEQLLLGWYRYRIADCQAAERWQAALWYLDRAVAAAPDDWTLYGERAQAHEKLGRAQASEADLERAAERGAGAALLLRLADAYAVRGRWDRAAAILGNAGARGPQPLGLWQRLALACLKTGDRDGYRRVCARLLRVAGPAPSVEVASPVAWLSALGPDAVEDYAQPLALADLAVSKTPPDARHVALQTQGAVLYRAGRFQDAVRRLGEGIQAAGGQGTARDWAFLAMAHQRLGETTEARKCLDKLAHHELKETASPWDRIENEILRQEAEALVKGEAVNR